MVAKVELSVPRKWGIRIKYFMVSFGCGYVAIFVVGLWWPPATSSKTWP